MLALERNPNDLGELNEAFRLLHSMKGSAAMMGFDRITVLTHHLETIPERVNDLVDGRGRDVWWTSICSWK